jgi:hypothetical protein
MFQNYIATKADLLAVEKALGFVLHPKMRFVFNDFSRIENTLTVSYDGKFIYVWTLNPIKLNYKIPHNLDIPDEWQSGWWANLPSEKLEKYLPQNFKKSTRFEIPITSGGFLTPFIELQKEKNLPNNPCTTRESYLATIVHEFGHVYWNSFKLWWPSDKEENINLLEEAKKLYTNKITNRESKIKYPSPIYASEVFAHCTEYYASELFWPKHKNNFDKFAVTQINTMITMEKNNNLNLEDSVLEPTKNQHNYSMVVGKLLTTEHPKDWPNLLIKL